MVVATDEMIDFEMSLPPTKEAFDFPAKGIDKGNLFGTKVATRSSNPIDFPPTPKSNKVDGVGH